MESSLPSVSHFFHLAAVQVRRELLDLAKHHFGPEGAGRRHHTDGIAPEAISSWIKLPGILAGSLLVFALSISAYVTPSLMGGTDVLTLPMLIAQQVGTSFNPNFAGALGVILLAVCFAIVIAYNRILARLSGEEGLA